jgi:hypothetical protein
LLKASTNYKKNSRILYLVTLDLTQLLQPRKHFKNHYIGAIKKMPSIFWIAIFIKSQRTYGGHKEFLDFELKGIVEIA